MTPPARLHVDPDADLIPESVARSGLLRGLCVGVLIETAGLGFLGGVVAALWMLGVGG